MIEILGWKMYGAFIAVLTILFGALGFLWSPPAGLLGYLGLFSGIGIFLNCIFLFLGETKAFPYLCKQAPLKWFFPDLEGEWSGHITSNWPLIAEKQGVLQQDGKPFTDNQVPMTIDIKARLLSFSVEAVSANKYQSSKTISCKIVKNSHNGFLLTYVFKSDVLSPLQTDSQSFLGSASIDIPKKDLSSLTGSFWTNRNWEKGLNTAGSISLQKKQTG